MKYTIAGIGELLWDIYGDEKYLGGVPANTAVHAHNLGHNGIIVSRVGKESSGDELINSLKERGVATQYIQRDGILGTGRIIIKRKPGTKPEYISSKAAAFDNLSFDESLQALTEKTDAVVFGTLGQRNDTAGETIRKFISLQKKAVIVYDAYFKGFRKGNKSLVENSLYLCDILKSNKKEFLELKEILSYKQSGNSGFISFLINKFGISLICITSGKWGCLLLKEDKTVYSPGVNVKPVDTNGAGDAFTAAMIIAFLKNEPLEMIAEQANYTGAYTVSRKGASPFYTINDIKIFTETHKKRNRKENLIPGFIQPADKQASLFSS